MGVIFRSNRKEAERIIKRELLGLLDLMGSTISYEIKQLQQKNIYAHALPAHYGYTRSHRLQTYTGYKSPTAKGITVVFSTRKYAAYLEKLVGRRWKTHLQDIDLKMDLEKMKMPSRRPYSSFIPGFIKGLKKVKKRVRGIKWKV